MAPADGEPCCECDSCLAIEAGTSLDVSELDAASNNGVEAMRDLVGRVAIGGSGRRRLYILDEVHMLSAAASNALLKTLEDPPSHVVFVLATTDPQKVLATIRSRTQHYEFRLISAEVLTEHLRHIASHAGLEVNDDAIRRAVELGHGSARDALSALDQIVAGGGFAERDSSIDDLAESLCERDAQRALCAVAEACQAGRDPRQLAEALLSHLRDAFLSVLAPNVVSLPDEAMELVSDQGRRLGPAAAVRAMDAIGDALQSMREAPDPRIPLEIALVHLTKPELDASALALVERIERLERMQRQGDHGKIDRQPDPVSGPDALGSRGALGSVLARQALAAQSTPASQPTPAAPPTPSAPAKSNLASSPTHEVSASDNGVDPAVRSELSLPSREELTLAWADHVLGVLRPKAKGLFGAGRFLEVVGDVAVFALPSEALRSKAEPMLADLEGALSAYFARRVPVRLIVDSEGTSGRTNEDQPRRRDHGAPTAGRTVQDEAMDAEVVDMVELRDAPHDVRTGLDRLAQAFPGAQIIGDEAPGAK